MFLIRLKEISSEGGYERIYDSLRNCKLLNKVYIANTPDFSSKVYLEYVDVCHFIYVNVRDLVGLSDDEIEDIILDLITCERAIVLDFEGVSFDDRVKFLDIVHDFKLEYHIPGKESLKVDLSKNHGNIIGVLKEIFLESFEAITYSPFDFYVDVTINKNLQIVNNGEVIGDLSKGEIIEFLTNESLGNKKIIDDYKKYKGVFEENNFNMMLYEPWVFLKMPNNFYELLLRYKYEVFDSIKNVFPENFKDIHVDIANILNKGSYIPIANIKKIIDGTDECINEKWYRDMIKRKGADIEWIKK